MKSVALRPAGSADLHGGGLDPVHLHRPLALNIAAGEPGDLERCCRTWSNLMRHAERAGAWRYLERESRRATAFAANTGAQALDFEARFRHVVALHGLGRDDEARQEAEALLVEARAAGVAAAVARLEEFVTGRG